MASGGAPIEEAVLDFIKICFSCPFGQGYGLTETGTSGCSTKKTDRTSGHVGGPTGGGAIRLRDLPDFEYMTTDKPNPRGEICIKGPAVFSGYYKRPDKTAEAFDEEGWFLTGDVGSVGPNGAVSIIDRCKNIFKLSQGEYIAPEKIENVYALTGSVAQVFVYGDSLKASLVAIVVPEEEHIKRWQEENKVEDACTSEEYLKLVFDDMLEMAKKKKLTGLEKPKKIYL